MNRSVSILFKLIAVLRITQMMILTKACLSTQLQDYRAHRLQIGNCIEIADCAGGVIIEEIKVCLDKCPGNTTIQTDPNWLYNKCVCPLARISSDFSICSDKCPNDQIAQQNSKLCLANIFQCELSYSQDMTMCGQNICFPNQNLLLYYRAQRCTCKASLPFFDLKTNSCVLTCPQDQVVLKDYKVCLVADTDCTRYMSSDKKTCGIYSWNICKKNEYLSKGSGSQPYTICVACPEATPIPDGGLNHCNSCSPNILDLTQSTCLFNPSQCTGSGIISSDGKICSYICNVREYAAQEAGYRKCRDMSECPFVDTRISPNVCLSSFEDCIGGYISIDEKFCLNICPSEQISTETVLIPQKLNYQKCVAKMSEIILILVGFALFAMLCSFLLCQGIIKAKIASQERKYIRDLFPVTTEEDDIHF